MRIQIKELRPSQISFVVSKKVAKTATARNLLKRRGYSISQRIIRDYPQGALLVFFLKKESIPLSFKNYEKEILGATKTALSDNSIQKKPQPKQKEQPR